MLIHVYVPVNDIYSRYFETTLTPYVWVVSGSSTPDSSTPSSLTIFALQLLIASHKQFRGGGSGGKSPPVLAFSLRVWGYSEPGIRCFSVQCVDESRVDQMVVDESGVKHMYTCTLHNTAIPSHFFAINSESCTLQRTVLLIILSHVTLLPK